LVQKCDSTDAKPYVGGQIGHASSTVDVADGVPARLVYLPPDWIWSSGHLRQVP
jgi:hypothetical protein